MKSSCVPCKNRHLKCDRRRPICTRCQKARMKLTCTYSTIRFRQSRLSIQTGIPDPDPFSSHPNGIVSSDDLVDPVRGPPAAPPQNSTPEETSSPREAALSQTPAPSPSSPEPWRRITYDRFPVPASPNISHRRAQSHSTDELIQVSPDGLLSSPTDGDYIPIACDPVRVKVARSESRYFDCYLQHAGVWLDIASPGQCFAQAVPRLALRTPVLYYSCLAYAAQVLYLWGRSDRDPADYYHNQAISLLIPLLDPKTRSVSTENLLATIVILRMSEQFSEPDEDAQCHLHGAFSLLTSSKAKWPPDRVDVTGIAFWTFVRQTLRICFLFEQECRFDLGIIDSSNLLSPARDEVWTNRMTYLLAKVCNACWSPLPAAEGCTQCLDDLEADINAWRESLPEAFKPWFYHQSRSEPFPTIRYLSKWHGLAWQQYYTAKTMLAVYRQKHGVLDSYVDVNNYIHTKILPSARLACGVVLSDDDVGACINGAHLAYWCGQFFTGRDEQGKLLDWLERFMERVKWPNRTCIERLQKLWGHIGGRAEGARDSPPLV